MAVAVCALALAAASSAWAADGDGFDDATADNCVPLKGSREGCPMADLVAKVWPRPASVRSGHNSSLITSIRNDGPDAAPRVELLVGLPGNVTVKSKPKGCKGASSLRCKVGGIPAGARRQLKIVLEAGSPGTATTGVSAFSAVLNESALAADGAADPNKKNSQGSVTLQIRS
ncbi:MAG: hypothetical protein EXQ70_01680 [Solirubrobacterales bacterium]|nr:hypothetical protein [Solirubrobacterales bacterium]